MKRKRRNKDDSVPEGETSQDAGFDDPFFHHSVTTATAVSSVEGEGEGGRKGGVCG